MREFTGIERRRNSFRRPRQSENRKKKLETPVFSEVSSRHLKWLRKTLCIEPIQQPQSKSCGKSWIIRFSLFTDLIWSQWFLFLKLLSTFFHGWRKKRDMTRGRRRRRKKGETDRAGFLIEKAKDLRNNGPLVKVDKNSSRCNHLVIFFY